jgi:hypothetical protein
VSTVTAVATRTVDADPATVYGLIADYREHHLRFLPSAFSSYQVEEGGIGSGTVVRFVLTAGGRKRQYRMRVDEPDPGRVLRESDTASSLVTTFTVTPEGERSRVQIETNWNGASGVGGFFERRFAPSALRRLYNDELTRLDEYARRYRDAQP